MLHILLDDDNYLDDDIAYCLKECVMHPEREESGIGRLICEEYLRLPMRDRRLLCNTYIGHWTCDGEQKCSECFILNGDDWEGLG